MERCPNCGAPARSGAKFCTTCGYRLPVVAETATEPNDSASAWPAPPTAPATAAAPDPGPPPGDDVPAPVSTWPAPASADPAPAIGSTQDAEAADAAVSPRADAVDDERDDATGRGSESLLIEETVTVPAPASQFESWSTGIIEEVAIDATDAPRGTAIARATALIDELRLLLPTLSAGGDAVSTGEALRDAVTAGEAHAADRAALRRALADLQANPGAIQSVLAFAQQAETVTALLDDYDALADGARQTISPATGDSPGLYP